MRQAFHGQETVDAPSPSRLLVGGGAALLILWAYLPTLRGLVEAWLGSYPQGPLALLAAVWIAWRERHRLAATERYSRPRGALWIALFSVAWAVAAALDISSLQNWMLFAILFTSVVALCGWRFAGVLAFPFIFLFLALPLPTPPVTWLQDVTAAISVGLLQLAGVPVVWEGHLLQTPAGNFEVAETCAGWRFIKATLPLALFYSYLTFHSLRRRITFVAVALLVAVLGNGLRAAGVIGLAEVVGIDAEMVRDHYTWGWFVFFFLMLGLFSAGKRWSDGPPVTRSAPKPSGSDNVESGAAMVVGLALLTGPVTGALWGTVDGSSGDPENTRPAPLAVRNWARVFIDGIPVRYYSEDSVIGAGWDFDVRLEHTSGREEGSILRRGRVPGLPASELVITAPDLRQVVWYGYCLGKVCAGDRLGARLLELRGLFTGARSLRIRAVSTPWSPNHGASRDRLRQAWLRFDDSGLAGTPVRGDSDKPKR